MKRILLILPLLCSTTVCMGREWKTASGSLSFEAEFVCYVKSEIAVKLPDGKVLNYPEQAFSEEDIEYAKKHQSEQDRKIDAALRLAQIFIERTEQEIKATEAKRKRNLELLEESKRRSAAIKAMQRQQYAYDLANWLIPKVRSGYADINSTRSTLAMYRSMQAHYVVGRLQTIDNLNDKNLQIYKRLVGTVKALRMKESPSQDWLDSHTRDIQVLLEDAGKNQKIIDKELDNVRMIPKPS